MLTETQLRAIMIRLSSSKAEEFLPHLNRAMAEYGIESEARAAAFVAQLAHESGEFRWMEEIWGPTAAQLRYEPKSELARGLGNTQVGDGKRFKGRGPIQLTGRANYRRFGELLKLDLIAAPERAASAEVGFRIAALYWASRGLNQLADAGDFKEITRRINGGFNGLTERLKYYELAKKALADSATRAAMPGRAAPRSKSGAVPKEPLMRGQEAIRRLTMPKGSKSRKSKTPAAVSRKARKKKR